MKFLFSSLLTLISICTVGQQYNEVVHYFSQDIVNLDYLPDHYLLADRVLFRTCPNDSCDVMEQLSIGTSLKVLSGSNVKDTINGIISYWYHVRAKEKNGYIWGGLIAQNHFGSSQNGKVKFVVGMEKIEQGIYKDPYDGQAYPQTYIYTQIRAYKDGEQLAKYSVKSMRSYDLNNRESYGYGTCNLGKSGLNQVDDIIQLHIPCRGGCGCSTGDTYIGWNGSDFKFLIEAFGTADAQYSEGDGIIFPSNMKGEDGFIIRSINRVLFDETDDQEKRQDKREQYLEYYVWDGKKLNKTARRTESVITNIDNY